MKYWRTPMDIDQVKVPRGEIHIIKDRCKGCGFCVEYCPRDVLEMSKEFNLKGYHPPYVKNEDNCVHCQLCEMMCPEFAIWVTLKEDRMSNEPARTNTNEKLSQKSYALG